MAKRIEPVEAKPEMPACSGCRYWIARGVDLGSAVGECHRFPPSGGVERPTAFGPLTLAILTRANGFCGEFQRK